MYVCVYMYETVCNWSLLDVNNGAYHSECFWIRIFLSFLRLFDRPFNLVQQAKCNSISKWRSWSLSTEIVNSCLNSVRWWRVKEVLWSVELSANHVCKTRERFSFHLLWGLSSDLSGHRFLLWVFTTNLNFWLDFLTFINLSLILTGLYRNSDFLFVVNWLVVFILWSLLQVLNCHCLSLVPDLDLFLNFFNSYILISLLFRVWRLTHVAATPALFLLALASNFFCVSDPLLSS